MKTAISVPDDLFKRAETVAKKMQVSRSELYSLALAAFLKTRDDEALTRQLNEFYRETPAEIDEAFQRAQFDLMKRSEWK
jgi:hypothetical protein